jgi:ATP-binding cassette subfamily C exporter for protease/lipase
MRAALNQCRGHLLPAAIFSALINALYIAPTLYMLQVYDRVVPTHGFLTLAMLTVALLFALATLVLLDRVRSHLLVRAGVRMEEKLTPVILDASLGRADTAIARQALRDFDVLRQTATGAAALALFDAPWTPVYIVICFLVHPLIGAMALVGGFALPAIAYANERAAQPRMREAQAAANFAYAHQEALLSTAEAIRSLGMRGAVVSRQHRHRHAMIDMQTSASLTAANYMAAAKFARLALQSLALGLGALLAINGEISGGSIFASSFLIARALAPIEQLVGTWKSIADGRSALRALDALLGSIRPDASRTSLPAPAGRIDVEHVIVGDPRSGAVIVGNVSFAAAPGEMLVVAGPSGAGKSTLLRALAGATPIDGGAIRFDGASQSDWPAERLGRYIGYLPQDNGLIAGTIKENISRFQSELSPGSAIDEAVVAAAKAAGIHEMILRLPEGYDHMLQLGGRGLSTGEAQRIALARAIYGDPPMLFLDEPNAHLDVEGDRQLLATLASLKQAGRTIVLVSHKASILPLADKLLLLRDGHVHQFGPPQDVMARLVAQEEDSAKVVTHG